MSDAELNRLWMEVVLSEDIPAQHMNMTVTARLYDRDPEEFIKLVAAKDPEAVGLLKLTCQRILNLHL